MKTIQEKPHYKWFIIGILSATLWLTVSANYEDYPTECPAVDPANYTVLLPHETDCEKYYACSNGRKILMHCPFMDHEGHRLHFSPKLHVCDFPNHAGCTAHTTTTEQTSAPTETTSSSPPSTTTTSTPATTTEQPSVPTETTTTSSPPSTTTTASPPSTTQEPTTTTEPPATTTESTTASDVSTSNPSTTTVVSSTTEQPTSSTGTSTNEPSITTTELPSASTILSTGNPPTTTVETSTTEQTTASAGSSTSEPPIISTTPQTSPGTEISTNEPPSSTTIESSTSSIPFPTNPTTDITSNSTSEATTISELPSTSSEAIPSTTSDTIDTTTEQIETTTTSSQIHPLCMESTTGVYLPHESHPHLYYECNYGNLIRRECDGSLVFDVTDQTCVWSSDTNYIEELTDAPPTDEPSNSSDVVNLCSSDDSNSRCGRYPHECECNKFYICINGDAVLRICPSSLNFNPSLKECDLPENVECGGGNGGGGGGNNPNITIPNECPPDNTGWAVQLAHETNCSLFYKCNWGEKVELPCRPGLHFNPKLQVCDWPCAAGCTAEGGDGTNTCHSPRNSGSETPVEQEPSLRFGIFRNLATIDNNINDES